MRAIIFFLRHSVFKFATYFSSPSLWLIKSNFELSRLSNFFFFHLFIFLFGSSLKSFIFLLSNREMIVCDKTASLTLLAVTKVAEAGQIKYQLSRWSKRNPTKISSLDQTNFLSLGWKFGSYKNNAFKPVEIQAR